MANGSPDEIQASRKRDDRKPREIDSRDLLNDATEITIVHDGERYRLRVTARNKLILTK